MSTPNGTGRGTEPGVPQNVAWSPARCYSDGKDEHLTRLRRAGGEARGLQRMTEDNQWRREVVSQVALATRAFEEVAVDLSVAHLQQRPPARRPAIGSSKGWVAGSATWCGYQANSERR